MTILITLLALAVLAAIGAVGFASSGVSDVSASSARSGAVNWLLSTTSHASVERRAAAVEVPDLSDAALGPVVAFLTTLPGLDPTSYQALLADGEVRTSSLQRMTGNQE